ncbi:MAG: cytochrome c-type biogenesis protein CcmH [Gemmatimonadetes bacterium]|nr:cytochrome c-type biogenesis protein CcmH [Gemmatimonadota bacterium]
MNRRIALSAVVFAAMWFGSIPGNAQTTAPPDSVALEARVREIAATIRCPVCLNLSIADSPSELARDMRDVIREHLKRGETEAQVKAFFEARYGEWVDMKPKAHGFNLLVWLLPGVLVLAGGGLIVLLVRRWIGNSAATATAASAGTPSDEDRHRVQDELARGELD